MQTYQHYINGQFIDPKAGVWFDTENPYTGEVWAKIPCGDADDVARAVAAAEALRGAQADFTAADAQKEALREQVRKRENPPIQRANWSVD